MADNKYTHLLRSFYGDIVERGNCEKLNDFFLEKSIVHFPGKDLKFDEYKEWLGSLTKFLRNINVEISNDKFENGCLCYDILFQGNRKEDMGSVEWRSSTKWKMEDNKVAESWANTTLNYSEIESALQGKSKSSSKSEQKQQAAGEKAIPMPAK